MEHTCPVCSKPYDGVFCTACTSSEADVEKKSEDSAADKSGVAYLVDLVSNRKIPVPTPRCKAGRDDLNDIVISGDQSISRFHFVITKNGDQYSVQDSKSRHGTFLNGNQITELEPINDGDVLKVGVSLFWFVIENPATLQAPESTLPVDVRLPAAEAKAAEPSEVHVSSKKQGRTEPTTATSTDIPALQPDAALAASLGLKESKFAHVTDQEKTIAPESAIQHGMLLTPSEIEDDIIERLDQANKAEAEAQSDSSAGEDDKEDREGKFESKAGDLDENLDKLNKLDKEKLEKISEKYSEREFERFNSASHDLPADITLTALPTEAQSEEHENEAASKDDEHREKSEVEDTAHAVTALGEPEADPKSEASDDDEKSEAPSAATLDKFAEIIGEAGSPSNVRFESEKHDSSLKEEIAETSANSVAAEAESESALRAETDKPVTASAKENSEDGNGLASGNGAKSLMSIVKESGPGTVPEWCSKYFGSELGQLARELTDLNDQVRLAQQRIREIESRVALLKGLRNTLLTATGEELVEACGKVFTILGWRAKVSEDDNQELKLDSDDRFSIARVVWTSTQAERTHLGQLSISQTRYWCEQGAEPKGILIVSRISDQAPAPLSSLDYNSELADYAARKNVCLMTTLQLLAIYRDVVINDVNADNLRGTIMSTSGWLNGFNLEPSTTSGEREEGGTNKLSSLLSA